MKLVGYGLSLGLHQGTFCQAARIVRQPLKGLKEAVETSSQSSLVLIEVIEQCFDLSKEGGLRLGTGKTRCGTIDLACNKAIIHPCHLVNQDPIVQHVTVRRTSG